MAGQRGNSTAVRDDKHRTLIPLRMFLHELINNGTRAVSHVDAALTLGRGPGGVVAPQRTCPGKLLVHFSRCHPLPLTQVGFAQALIDGHLKPQLTSDDLRGVAGTDEIRGEDRGDVFALEQVSSRARLRVAYL